MAITQIGSPQKEKASAWDKIANVMGFAQTAVGIGTSADKLFGGAPDPAVATDPSTGLKTPEMASAKVADEFNPLKRRLFGR